jgi:hypothetical protein
MGSPQNGALQPLVDLVMRAEDFLAELLAGFFSSLDSSFFIFSGLVLLVVVGCMYFDGQRKAREEAALRMRLAYEAKMKLEHRPQGWTLEEIAPFDGEDPEKPVVFACKGVCYNVWRGRDEFYGKGACYQVFSGTNATRLLAKGILEPETEEERKEPLSWFEKDTLASECSSVEVDCPSSRSALTDSSSLAHSSHTLLSHTPLTRSSLYASPQIG